MFNGQWPFFKYKSSKRKFKTAPKTISEFSMTVKTLFFSWISIKKNRKKMFPKKN